MNLLIKQGLVLEDPWVKINKAESPLTDYPWFSLLPLTTLIEHQKWPLPQAWIGAWFETGTPASLFTQHILDLPLLSIDVQDYTDGRFFSLATTLKRTLCYQGELRIAGNFLLDQMAMLTDCGADSFSLPEGSDYEHALYILNNSPRANLHTSTRSTPQHTNSQVPYEPEYTSR